MKVLQFCSCILYWWAQFDGINSFGKMFFFFFFIFVRKVDVTKFQMAFGCLFETVHWIFDCFCCVCLIVYVFVFVLWLLFLSLFLFLLCFFLLLFIFLFVCFLSTLTVTQISTQNSFGKYICFGGWIHTDPTSLSTNGSTQNLEH